MACTYWLLVKRQIYFGVGFILISVDFKCNNQEEKLTMYWARRALRASGGLSFKKF